MSIYLFTVAPYHSTTGFASLTNGIMEYWNDGILGY
jgi:hypothetical protein